MIAQRKCQVAWVRDTRRFHCDHASVPEATCTEPKFPFESCSVFKRCFKGKEARGSFSIPRRLQGTTTDNMSQTTKIKHVTKEVLEEYVLPKENQQIVRVLAGRGNNLHEVEEPSGASYLVSMPVKFRKNIWIKRGDFVIVEPIEEGDKVKAEIQHILYRNQIKYIKEEGLWCVGATTSFVPLSSRITRSLM